MAVYINNFFKKTIDKIGEEDCLTEEQIKQLPIFDYRRDGMPDEPLSWEKQYRLILLALMEIDGDFLVEGEVEEGRLYLLKGTGIAKISQIGNKWQCVHRDDIVFFYPGKDHTSVAEKSSDWNKEQWKDFLKGKIQKEEK